MPELHPDVIITEEEFHIFPGDLEYGDDDIRDETYGVPDEHVAPIAEAILRILVDRGIDPETVYFSGHDGTDPDPDGTKRRDLETGTRRIAEETEELIIAGSGEDDPTGLALAEVDRAKDAREEALFKQLGDEQVPAYYMSRVDQLLDSAESYTNPIHFAAATATSQIVVYDRGIVDAFDLDMPSLSVLATETQLAAAMLLRIHPNYVPVGEGLPEFA